MLKIMKMLFSQKIKNKLALFLIIINKIILFFQENKMPFSPATWNTFFVASKSIHIGEAKNFSI